MAEQTVEFGILNVVAHPHGPGVYKALLERAANREINFWGDLNGAIRAPREVEPGIYQTEIVVGVELDLDAPLIDRSSYREVGPDDAEVRLSGQHLYNGRVFVLTFLEHDHYLFFESKNEFGKNLSPNRAQRFFRRLFSQEVLGSDSPYVDVTVVPEDDTLEMLLGIERLDKVEIFLQKPNPADVNDDEVQGALADLEAQGAKSQFIRLMRAPKVSSIVLNAQNYIRAKVAQFNGYVKASGKTADGEPFAGSTKQYPKVINATLDATSAVTGIAIRVAKQARQRSEGEPNVD